MKKTNRIKVALPAIKTREEAEAVMNELAGTANNKIKFTAQMDAEILKVKERYEGNIAVCDADLTAKTDALRVWAETNPDEFAKGRKSIEFSTGTLGFRTGTPKLALLSRAFTWEKVTSLVEVFLPNFIRQKPEVDKESIIAQRDELEKLGALTKCGVKVVQGESFFVEPKLTEVETRQTVQEAA